MRTLFQNAACMFAVLALLLPSAGASAQCGSTCCCEAKAAAAGDYQARGVLGNPGCCGCSLDQQAEPQSAVPEYAASSTDGPAMGLHAGVSGPRHADAARASTTARVRGSTPYSRQPIYKLVLSYLC